MNPLCLRSPRLRTVTARSILFTALLVFAFCDSAFAQSEGKFALGADYSIHLPSDRKAIDGHRGVGLLWRYGHGKTGWGLHWALNWFSADVDQPEIGTELGVLKVRPVMIGYGYTRVMGRTKLTGSLVGGYAIAKMSLRDEAAAAYRDRLAVTGVELDAGNTFTARPQFSVWYDISKKIGFNASVSYIVARPDVTIRSSRGVEKRNINADLFTVKFGAVYSIWPWK